MESILCLVDTTQKNMRVPPLEKHLGYLLRRVSNAASGALARALKEEQTSIAEWVVLREVY